MTNPYVAQMRQWRQTLTKDQRWAILIAADPDALASALALKRIMAHRVRGVDIFRINEVTRPDNLAMIRYLRIPAKLWQPEKADLYTNFAMVDSQPHHNPAFQGIPFDLIIDHHPLTAGQLPQAPYCDIRPGFGATSTMMTRYLQGLRIKPGPLLSTALLYGIRTDTATFERSGGEEDLRAYQWLIKHADATLLRRIIRSEYLRAWLPLFSRAFRSLRDCRGGAMVWLNEVESPRSSSSSACTAASCARSRPAPRPWPKMPASRPCTARRWNPRPCRPWPTGPEQDHIPAMKADEGR